jgi:hypothetical protein
VHAYCFAQPGSEIARHCAGASLKRSAALKGSPALGYGTITPKHNDRANDRDHHAVEVEAGDSHAAQGVEYEPAHNSPDDAEDPVSLTILLAMKPAIRPNTIQPIIAIWRSPICGRIAAQRNGRLGRCGSFPFSQASRKTVD